MEEEEGDCLLTGREVRAEGEEDSCSWCGYPAAAHPGNYPVKPDRDQSPMMDDLKEQLAAIEHQRWAEWQQYVHSLCERRKDGALIIPAGHVMRWEQQIKTPYSELSEHEKEMDRRQVDRYWYLINYLWYLINYLVKGE